MLTPNNTELIAHGKTAKEVATLIHADEVVYQDLEDLKAACIEAAEGENEINDFEVGVFCGQYQTEVPDSYFEHISRLHGKGAPKVVTIEAGDEETGSERATIVANGGAINVADRKRKVSEDDMGARKEAKSWGDPKYVHQNTANH